MGNNGEIRQFHSDSQKSTFIFKLDFYVASVSFPIIMEVSLAVVVVEVAVVCWFLKFIAADMKI